MHRLKSIWKVFQSSIRGVDSPHQLALGVALGMMIGLIPNESLLVYVIAAVAILTPANLLCLILSAVVFHFVGLAGDEIWHPIGYWLLSESSLESICTDF